MKLFYFLILTYWLLMTISCSQNVPTEAPSKSENAIPVAETVQQSDALFAQRTDVAKLREAVRTLARTRNADARNFEVEWKFAKYNYFLGKQTTNETEADKILKDGYAAGLIASRMEPGKPDGYFWAAANLGEQAKRSPITVGLKSKAEIHDLMQKVIDIQPTYSGASAYDGQAQLELATRLTGGSAEKAVEILEKALTVEKGNGYLHLHLAEAYLAVERKDEAKKQLDILLKMTPNPEYLPEHQEVVGAAKKMLETKF